MRALFSPGRLQAVAGYALEDILSTYPLEFAVDGCNDKAHESSPTGKAAGRTGVLGVESQCSQRWAEWETLRISNVLFSVARRLARDLAVRLAHDFELNLVFASLHA